MAKYLFIVAATVVYVFCYYFYHTPQTFAQKLTCTPPPSTLSISPVKFRHHLIHNSLWLFIYLFTFFSSPFCTKN